MPTVEERLEAIESRNQRVEADKAWEGSLVRRLLIMLITYLLIGLYMTFLGVNRPWLNALIPTTGFLLSTLTLQVAKDVWIRSRLGE